MGGFFGVVMSVVNLKTGSSTGSAVLGGLVSGLLFGAVMAMLVRSVLAWDDRRHGERQAARLELLDGEAWVYLRHER